MRRGLASALAGVTLRENQLGLPVLTGASTGAALNGCPRPRHPGPGTPLGFSRSSIVRCARTGAARTVRPGNAAFIGTRWPCWFQRIDRARREPAVPVSPATRIRGASVASANPCRGETGAGASGTQTEFCVPSFLGLARLRALVVRVERSLAAESESGEDVEVAVGHTRVSGAGRATSTASSWAVSGSKATGRAGSEQRPRRLRGANARRGEHPAAMDLVKPRVDPTPKSPWPCDA